MLGAQVAKATENSVELADGRMIRCDLVVAGVGSAPDIDLAQAAGAAIANGVIVDHAFRTTVPNLFAAGDCCAFPYRGKYVRLESWRAARDHANHVARALLGDETAYAKTPWFWSDQYELTLQFAGLAEPDRPFVRRDLGGGAFILLQTDENGRLAAAAGIGTGSAVAKDIRLAEMMIERGIMPDPGNLADASVNLKALLKG